MLRLSRYAIRALVPFALGALFATAACAQETPGAAAAAQEPPPVESPEAPPATPAPTAEAAAPDAGAPDPAELPAIVAKVNGRDITKEELLEEAAATRSQMSQRGLPPGMLGDGFFRQVLDQVVAGLLVYQEAEEKGFAATDAEVQERVGELTSRLGSEAELEEALGAQGMTLGELQDNMRRNVTVQKFLEQEVLSDVEVSEESQRQFYQENLGQMQQPEQVRVSHVLIALGKEATEEEKAAARKEAEEVLAEARAGGDFAALAREHSDDPGSKERGGELPWLSPGETVEPFDEAAFAMAAGELSGVVESPFGFHVIKLHEKKSASTRSFDEVKDRIGEFLKQRQAQTKVQALVEKLRSEAQIEIFI